MIRLRWSFLSAWGVPLTLIAVAVLLGVHAFGVWNERVKARQRIEAQATLVANLAEEHARLMFHNARLAAETVAQEFRDVDWSQNSSRADWLRLRTLAQSMPGLNRLVLFDATGALRLESRDFPGRSVSIRDRLYFQQHRTSPDVGLHVGVPIVSRITPDHVFPVSRRLETPAGAFNGIVSLGMQVKLFEDFYANLDIGKRGNLTLLRTDGVILAREPRGEEVIGQRIDLTDLFPDFYAGALEGVTEGWSPVDGEHRAFAYRHLESFGVVLVAGVALEDALLPWRREMITTILTVAPALLLLLAMTLAFRRSALRLQQSVVERDRLVQERDLANADLQRFAEVAAHHFQEPARRLVSYAGLLRKRLPMNRLDSETGTFLCHIEEQSAHLRALVHDVQLYLNAGRPGGPQTGTAADDIVREALSRFQKRMAAAGIDVVLSPLPAVSLDRKRLLDVMVLLLDNAVTALEGTSGEAPRQITVSGRTEDGRVLVSVADTGPGIPPAYHERVFRVFERLDYGPAGGESGTGIGLAIVRRIAASVGGTAWVVSVDGGGTEVCVEFPDGEV